MRTWQFGAIGTAWEVSTLEPLAPDVQEAVLDLVERFDRTWSRFRPDSVVTAVAAGPGRWVLPDEAAGLLAFYDELHDATDGAINPLVGRTLADLGYDAGYTLRPTDDPAPVPDWSTVTFDAPTLLTTEPVVLDVGAAGKGLLVDLVSAVVADRAGQFTVDASGDLRHGGNSPVRVALEDPHDPTRAIGIIDVGPGRSLCASATNRRAWGDGLHHVLDARTGRPAHDVVATWVVSSQSCMVADGLATAHFLADPGVLVARFEHDFVRMHADGRVEWSPDFPGEIFV